LKFETIKNALLYCIKLSDETDRFFVQYLPQDSEDAAISKTIITLCKNLNVIADGVEQKNFMIENGCDFIQWYYYSRPLSIKDMTEYMCRF